MNDTSVLASCLARLSWPPERLAREINKRCGTGTISSKAPYNWLKGACPRRRLPYIVAKILSDQLGESVAVEALWPEHFPAAAPPCQHIPAQRRTLSSAARPAALDPVTASVDWLVADDAPPPSRTRGAEVPDVAVDMLTARIQQLRQLDDSCSSGLVLDWALQDLQWAKKLAGTYSYGPATGLRLHRIIAELGQLTAWLTADQGMDELSNSRFLTALGAARAAGDRPLAAYIISCMSYRAAWAGRAEEALRLIRIARKGSAQEDMVADAGRAWLELGRPRRAEWHLAHGIDLLRGSQPRNLLLHSASLAEARLAHREVDGAAEAAADALTLAESVTSQRAHSRLMALRGRFGRYDTPVAREIVQRADDLLDADRARTAC